TFFLHQIAPPTCSNVIKAFFYWCISFSAIFSETKSRPHILLVPKCLGCQIIITTNELIVASSGTNPKKLNVHPACDGVRNLSSVYSLSLNDPHPVKIDYPKGLITPLNESFLSLCRRLLHQIFNTPPGWFDPCLTDCFCPLQKIMILQCSPMRQHFFSSPCKNCNCVSSSLSPQNKETNHIFEPFPHPTAVQIILLEYIDYENMVK
ncbi:hypothetical protein JTE90_000100, partial [Oedothorax gibbosus]